MTSDQNDQNAEVIELPLTPQDEADLEALHGEEPIEIPAPSFHPILQVWKEVLSNSEAERVLRIEADWAVRVCGTYAEMTFAKIERFRTLYFDLIDEMRAVLHYEIESDEDCMKPATPAEDLEHNIHHYKNVLRDWQLTLLQHQLDWRPTHDDAAEILAAIGEAQRMFFGAGGEGGLMSHLQFIGFGEVWSETDHEDLQQAILEFRQTYDGEGDDE